MTPDEIAALPYRPCVGVVLTDGQGRVFAGQRADMDTPAWQMPQGGIDTGETPVAAALRELREETGVKRKHVTVLGETADWLPYDLPPEVLPYRGKYRGQTQKWVLMRLDAGDDVIDLTHEDVEFSDWRWMTGRDLLDLIVPFKRDIYARVLTEFELR
ncbi:Adenosine (5')-pentaphospho-(5'')-adenosine pyrophosphohydrolase [Roseibacterium elongatum DSM 19469]|uniref:RNA pyrophosphohydrolase n=1 Tax=Roseicyclus elongatus DSM 19469 TaxID=1294273 RepID=W8RZR2_9RHOB|nr:RNA pyrophosphohydrolase [Roseibacterium elongatum]AHM03357.1 Adenosine (5')-pentaphospho-(5'')-adenosine pyrophosphohydrolase [Roseibacterium elongatum DSM 19469]